MFSTENLALKDDTTSKVHSFLKNCNSQYSINKFGDIRGWYVPSASVNISS